MNNMTTKHFIHCSKCNKRLIERMQNGLWRFVFGKKPEDGKGPPVEIIIHGSLKIRCIRRNCGEWNILNYFPTIVNQSVPTEQDDAGFNKI